MTYFPNVNTENMHRNKAALYQGGSLGHSFGAVEKSIFPSFSNPEVAFPDVST